jgi:uncharacterized membrane protein (UPF0136 family)
MKIEAKIAITNWITFLTIYFFWLVFNWFLNPEIIAEPPLFKWGLFMIYQTFVWAFIPAVLLIFVLTLMDMLMFYNTKGEKVLRKIIIQTAIVFVAPVLMMVMKFEQIPLLVMIMIALIVSQVLRYYKIRKITSA